jgi:hypothetical protein
MKPSPLLQRAECVAENLDEEDLFVTIEWKWTGYLSYFFDREVFSLISAPLLFGGKEEALRLLQRDIDLTHSNGGRVYVVDINQYPTESLQWLESQTSLSEWDFQRLRGMPAFVCDEVAFQELLRID